MTDEKREITSGAPDRIPRFSDVNRWKGQLNFTLSRKGNRTGKIKDSVQNCKSTVVVADKSQPKPWISRLARDPAFLASDLLKMHCLVIRALGPGQPVEFYLTRDS